MMAENLKLTEIEFWDTYWKNCEIPSTVDLDFSFERSLTTVLKKYLKNEVLSGDVLEIGCAPGKWLAYMATEFSLNPHGIEYSAIGMEATKNNLTYLGLDSTGIYAGDFFKMSPDRQFDVVMSFGFIEHFQDVDSVVELHIKWLKPGGILILEVPNFSGFNKLIQRVLDNEILEKHNLNIMNLDYFRSFVNKFNMKPIFIGHNGSFEPNLFIGREGRVNYLQLMVNVCIQLLKKIRKFRCWDSINNRLFSSCIIAIYKKNSV